MIPASGRSFVANRPRARRASIVRGNELAKSAERLRPIAAAQRAPSVEGQVACRCRQDGVSPAMARMPLGDKAARALWMIAVLPDAAWRSLQDRRKRVAAPPLRCSTVVVDEHRGSVGGLRLGATLADVFEVFGPGIIDPPPSRNPKAPALPGGLEAPPGSRPGTRISRVAYSDALVYVAESCGVYAICVWRKGTSTACGVHLGDSRASIQARHHDSQCGHVHDDLEHPGYKYCRARVGAHYLWFGEDPIRSVAIALCPVY
jgi:hypothetical protein